jgi:hypothetical protein
MNMASRFTNLHAQAPRFTLATLVAHPGVTTSELADLTGRSYQVTSDILRALTAAGLVYSSGRRQCLPSRDDSSQARTAGAFSFGSWLPATLSVTPAGVAHLAECPDGPRRNTSGHDRRRAFTEGVIVDTLTKFGPLTRGTLRERSGCSTTTLQHYVLRMIAHGKLVRTDRTPQAALYSLAAQVQA